MAIAFAEFVPSTLPPFTYCAFISTLCCSHSLLHPLEGGRKQLGIKLLAKVSPGKLHNLGNFLLLFFFNIHSVCRRKCSHRLMVLKFRNTTMFVSRSILAILLTGFFFTSVLHSKYLLTFPQLNLIIQRQICSSLSTLAHYTLGRCFSRPKKPPPTRMGMMHFPSTISTMWSCASMLLFVINKKKKSLYLET